MTTAKKATRATQARGIQDILAAARPRETEVSLCLAGDLAADADRISSELERIGAGYAASSLADVDPRAALTAELAKVHTKMRAAQTTFRFRALPHYDWSNLMAAHPAREGKRENWNLDTFPQAIVAASCIDPVMTLEESEALHTLINENDRALLFNGAWRANNGATQVPFSLAASPSPSS